MLQGRVALQKYYSDTRHGVYTQEVFGNYKERLIRLVNKKVSC